MAVTVDLPIPKEPIARRVVPLIYADAVVVSGRKVGYIPSSDQTLQRALAALGVDSKELTMDDVAKADLSTFQTIINLLEFKMPVRGAVESARIHHQWMPDRMSVEAGITAAAKLELEKRGHALRTQSALGVVQAITWDGLTMNGAADARKIARARTE